MKIAYYMPFKPMGHKNPSGDLIIGTEIFDHLKQSGHTISLTSRLRCRWLYYRPLKLIQLLLERRRVVRLLKKNRPDIWLTYHSYYKAPDLLGPYCAHRLGIPYVIFQGIYSTKRRKEFTTLPGFLLNTKALKQAEHLFTNKHRDYHNLRRIKKKNDLTYIAPGIHPDHFNYSKCDRTAQRSKWRVDKEVVIITAAMMRKGVKTEGISTVIEACAHLKERGLNIKLVIVGDGECRGQLEQAAKECLGTNALFTGKIAREQMYKFYSGADIFAFPGINESLGMVYLEAQSCRLPAVAYEDWGAKEAILHEKTGLLSKASAPEEFIANLEKLVTDQLMREKMGSNGEYHIRSNHNIKNNYDQLQSKLIELTDSVNHPADKAELPR